jgi:hypothetical protein
MVEDKPLSSCTNPHVEQGLLVEDAKPYDREKSVNILHVQSATPEYATY